MNRPDERRGPWTQTFTGGAFFPFDSRPDEVRIDDIAHALSMQCRFNGHCREFYSVAQHSVLVSLAVERATSDASLALVGLLHDAAEAYVGDMVRPIKRQLPRFADIEDGVLRVILRRFGLDDYFRMPVIVQQADAVALATEKRDLMTAPPFTWEKLPEPWPERIEPWEPARARAAFLTRFHALYLEDK